jgi:hypothetical protein
MLGVGAALLLAARPVAAGAASASGVILRETTFQQYSVFSSNAMLVRRLFSPLTAQKIEREVSSSGKTLAGQPVDLAKERFLIYVPPEPGTHRYALLVFVPPWQEARLPSGWVATLDRQGVIFVTAARSGNDEPALERREPLALLAATNVMSQYPVDPERVYVAGFSGGSRIALRLALGYPDLFRGALLNAGSDPIGNKGVPIPSRELFLRFQESTRLVYVTGARDTAHAADDMLSIRSMHQWCVFNLESYTQPRIGHEVADGALLSQALIYLLRGTIRNAEKLPDCRSRLDAEVTAQLGSVRELFAGGRRADAAELLARTDEQFGGLAAPQSIVLSTGLR